MSLILFLSNMGSTIFGFFLPSEKLASVLAPWEDFGDEHEEQIDKTAKEEAKANIIAIATVR